VPGPKLSRFLRWLDVFLRGAHLSSVVLFGAVVLGASVSGQIAGLAVLCSGLTMFAVEVWNRPEMLRQWTGASLLLKLGLVAWMLLDTSLRLPLFWLIVGWSAMFSHAPSTFRHRRWY
jgi:hypothetical protein